MKISEEMEPSNGEKAEDSKHTSAMATSSKEVNYERRNEGADMSGQLFEVKMIALLFLRTINSRQNFSVGSNLKAAGCFDDIILRLKNKTIFLQLKHKKNAAIYDSQLTLLNGDFGLLKYYKCFCDMKKNWAEKNKDLKYCGDFKNYLFVIYTNAVFKSKKSDYLNNNDDWQGLIDTGGSVHCFSEQQFPDIHEYFSSLSRYKKLLKDVVNGSTTCTEETILSIVKKIWNKDAKNVPKNEDLNKILSELEKLDLSDYKDFLSRLWIFTGQKRESELDPLIKEEIKTACGTDSSYIRCIADVQAWWKSAKRYLRKESKFWQEIVKDCVADVSNQKAKEFSELNVRFSGEEINSLKKSLPSNCRIIHIDNEKCNIFSCVKASQSFEKNFLVSGDTLHSCISQVLTLWEQSTDYVLIIDGGTDSDTVVKDLVGFLNEQSQKSVILITNSEDTMVGKLKELTTLETYIDTFSLSQLDQESFDRILDCNVTFQGHSVYLKDLADKSAIEKFVTADILRKLLLGLEIGEKLPEEDEYFISRKLSRKHPVNTAGNHSAEGKIYSDIKQIMALSDKVILISGDPGMGKSTQLTHFASKWKFATPTTWIARINLNDESNVLSTNKSSLALDLLETGSKIDTEFERRLFEHRVKNEGKVVVMLDGYDEVCPNYGDKVIAIVNELNDTKVEKIFVTSRPVMQNKLEKDLPTVAFELMPFTEKDQKNFMLKFWKDKSGGKHKLDTFIEQLLQVTSDSVSNYHKEFTAIPLQIKILAEVFKAEGEKFCDDGDLNLPDKLDLLQLYEKMIEKKWELYCLKNSVDISKPSVERNFVMQKKELEENHMYCAVYSLLDENQMKSLKNSVSVTEKAKKFLEKLKSGHERTDIVFDVINDKPTFLHRTFAEYFAAMWFSQNFQDEKEFIRKHILRPTFKVIRQFFNQMLARDFPLHRAVLNGNKRSVEALVTGSCDVNTRDIGGRTALHLAVMAHLDIHNDIGYEYYRFDPWHLSGNYVYVTDTVEHQITSILAQRTSTLELNSKDEVLSWSPIRLADQIGAWSCIDLLLGKGIRCSDLISVKLSNMWHILNCCSRESLLHLVKFVDSPKVDVGRSDLAFPSSREEINILITTLHQAAEHGRLELVKFLLDHGADINEQTKLIEYSEICRLNKQSERHEVDASRKSQKELSSHPENVGNSQTVSSDQKISQMPDKKLGLSKASSGTLLSNQKTSHVHGKNAELLKATSEPTSLDQKSSPFVEMNNNSLDATSSKNIPAKQNPVKNVNTEKLTDDERSVLVGENIRGTYLNQGMSMGSIEDFDNKMIWKISLWSASRFGELHKVTPLMYAARRGHFDVVKYLVNQGADTSLCDSHNQDAFMYAVRGGHLEVIKFLWNSTDIKQSNRIEHFYPLHMSVSLGNLEVLEFLLNTQAFDVNEYSWCDKVRLSDFGTPLLFAVKAENAEIVELLCKHGADTNAVDTYGKTPLKIAERMERLKNVLKSHGAKLNS
ncbi:uncharacterized protein [Periplaneta americana]|uniref:uncharacterized protein n=1 Tax=Periplaneta americana TaxID=6978 RepID=UPI0037E86793